MTRRVVERSSSTHPSGATELHFAMTEAVVEGVEAVLLPSGDRPPERGLIGLLHASTGRKRRTLLLREVIMPRPGEVTFDRRKGLLFSSGYKSRACTLAGASGAGLIFVHTHPVWPGYESSFPRPSPEDSEADPRDLFALGMSLSAGAPLAAGILSDAGRWSVREYSFRFPGTVEEVHDPLFGAAAGAVTYASAVRIVGPELRKLPTSLSADGPAGADGAIARDEQDSSVRLWGERGQRALASLRVGHVGAGGVGGILAEHTARLGVGEALFIDFDRLSLENFNRSQGASRNEAARGEFKVEVASRVASAASTAPQFKAGAIVGSVVEGNCIADLIDCDIILNAADSPWARQVLDHLAFAHLIPVVHGGTVLMGDPNTGRLIAGKSEVSATAPGHPCSECAGVYTRAEVSEAQEHPAARGRRRYLSISGAAKIDVAELRAPSVIAFNAIVAGLMELRLLAIALGTTGDAVIGVQRFHVLEGTMDWALTERCRSECLRADTTALGDNYELPTGTDLDFALARATSPAPKAT